MVILIVFAFVAGIVTILSPCILPILPIILSSSSAGGKKRPFGIVVGFVASFTFFTLFLSSIVRIFGIPADSLRMLSVVIIALFGLSLIIPGVQTLIEKLFAKLSSRIPQSNQQDASLWGGVLIGLSLGLLWTPCVGPILASVISLAITGTVTASAFLITLSYSLGTAIPMLIILFTGRAIFQKIPWLLSNSAKIQRAFGVVMIITALAIFLNFDRKFQSFVLDKFPQYGAGLTSLEDNQVVLQELEDMNFEATSDAPEIILGGEWFNSQPLKLFELKGKVVLIDFWTYTCINCQRTFPYLRSWHEKYKDQGLVIIGVHSPEFEFEKDADNLAQAISDFGLKYPIMQDNNFETWRAYNNRYWPAKYFIDKNGKIRSSHFGEGAYDESEKIIQELLTETGVEVSNEINNPSYSVATNTPETYLGYARAQRLVSPQNILKDKLLKYSKPAFLSTNFWALEGDWIVGEEYSKASSSSALYIRFDAKEVYLVARGSGNVNVYLDDEIYASFKVDQDKLYDVVKLPIQSEHTLKLEFLDGNVEVYAFTFG